MLGIDEVQAQHRTEAIGWDGGRLSGCFFAALARGCAVEAAFRLAVNRLDGSYLEAPRLFCGGERVA